MSLLAYATSLHLGPFSLALAVSSGLYMMGYPVALPVCLTGVAAAGTGLLFFISPVLTIRPLGGAHHVSRAEIPAIPDAGVPPLTCFYPTNTAPPAGGVAWLPFGRDTRYLRGMAAYSRMPFFLLRDMQLTQVAVSERAAPLPLVLPNGAHRDIVVFSHGLAGFQHLSSLMLSSLAARGAVVVAVGHTDGSAAFCQDGSGSVAVPFRSTLEWTPEDREPQLVHRTAELRQVLRRIESGDLWRALGFEEAEVAKSLAARPTVTLTGHSFGAATVLAAAMQEENDAGVAEKLVSSVVVYDPWHIPLSRSLFKQPIETGAATYTTPTLQFHSEGWRRWSESWDFWEGVNRSIREQKLAGAAKKRIDDAVAKRKQNRRTAAVRAGDEDWMQVIVSPATGHLSYTDMAVLSPVVYKASYVARDQRPQMVEWVNGTLAFSAEQRTPLDA